MKMDSFHYAASYFVLASKAAMKIFTWSQVFELKRSKILHSEKWIEISHISALNGRLVYGVKKGNIAYRVFGQLKGCFQNSDDSQQNLPFPPLEKAY